jgi:hypothetical protein
VPFSEGLAHGLECDRRTDGDEMIALVDVDPWARSSIEHSANAFS